MSSLTLPSVRGVTQPTPSSLTVRRGWGGGGGNASRRPAASKRRKGKTDTKAVPGLTVVQAVEVKGGFGGPPVTTLSTSTKVKPTAIARPRGIKLLKKKVQQMASAARFFRQASQTESRKNEQGSKAFYNLKNKEKASSQQTTTPLQPRQNALNVPDGDEVDPMDRKMLRYNTAQRGKLNKMIGIDRTEMAAQLDRQKSEENQSRYRKLNKMGLSDKEIYIAQQAQNVKHQHRQSMLSKQSSKGGISDKAKHILFGEAHVQHVDKSNNLNRTNSGNSSNPNSFTTDHDFEKVQLNAKAASKLGMTQKQLARGLQDEEVRRHHREMVRGKATDVNVAKVKRFFGKTFAKPHALADELLKLGVTNATLQRFRTIQKSYSSLNLFHDPNKPKSALPSIVDAETSKEGAVMGLTENELRAAKETVEKRKEINAAHKAAVKPQSKDKIQNVLKHRRPSTLVRERKEAVLEMLGVSEEEYKKFHMLQKAYRTLGFHNEAEAEAAEVKRRQSQQEEKVLQEKASGHARKQSQLVDLGRVFEETLCDPEKLLDFRSYCTSNFAEESIHFYVAAGEYAEFASDKQEPPTVEELLEQAKVIIDLYIRDDSAELVNVSHDHRVNIINVVEKKNVTAKELATVFDSCRTEVYQLMKKDLFRRYIQTPQYLEKSKKSKRSSVLCI